MGIIGSSGRDQWIPKQIDPERGEELPIPAENQPWQAPAASKPLTARLTLPGSKSLTNRELVLAALADAPSVLHRPLHARDTALMVDGLRALGTGITEIPGDGAYGSDLKITPQELHGGFIDGGLAGTVLRFLPIVAALALGPSSVDGDPYSRKRPQLSTIQALRDLGAEVRDDGRGTLPFTVHGTGQVRGGELNIDASTSSQFVSALLLAAPRFANGLTLSHTGATLPSLPHIQMTISCLAGHGVKVLNPQSGVWIVSPQVIRAKDTTLEADLSNAAPFLGAALLAGGMVSVTGWPSETTQVGNELLSILPKIGGQLSRNGETITLDGGVGVRGGAPLSAVNLDLSSCGELVPTIATLLAFADGESTLSGIAHLRGHETDRLAALANEINNLGGEVQEKPDALVIRPRPLRGGVWRSYADHRMATSGALAGLVVPGVSVDDLGATTKTLPQFAELWNKMLGLESQSHWESLTL